LAQARPLKLRYTLPALADLDSILDYITAQSPQAAARVHTRIQLMIDLLPIYPFIGVRTDDPTIRRLTTTPYPYLVFYEVSSDGPACRPPAFWARSKSAAIGPLQPFRIPR
jgi:plasmid stabilization system protein ParE